MKKVRSHLNGKSRGITSYTLLKRIFWTIAKLYRIPPLKFPELLSRYSNDPMNVERQTEQGRSQASNNLTDALTGDNISFLQLIRGFKVLRIWRIRITVETWREHEKNKPPMIIIIDEKLSRLNTRSAGKDSNI